MHELHKFFDDHKLIGIVRASEHEDAVNIARAVLAGGFKIIEISMNIPQAPKLIESLCKKEHGNGYLVGAGTVTDGEIAQRAINAGAKFVSSQFTDKAILTVCKNNNSFVIQGAATPTEVMDAIGLSVDLVNLYPIDLLGGASYAPRLKKFCPISKLMASGGVTCENVLDHIRTGVAAVAIGRAICDKQLVRSHNWQEITDRARKFQQKLDSLKVAR